MLYKFLDKPKDILSRHFDRKTIRACMGTLLSNILSEYGGRIDLGIPMCNGKRKYDSISDVLDAFDSAYDVAMHKPYDYEIKKCNDVAQTVLYGEMSDAARKSFFEQSDSFVQDMMASAINLYKFPEYQGWHKSLQNMDLSMEAQFGLDWQKQDSAKSRRRLPDVDLLCEGQQSEYEF